jgi:hypothetical protein
MAHEQRSGIPHTAYRPSVLRQSPCLGFGKNSERIRSPLPELILERITSGVFYDIVNGGGDVRNDYGRRFEDYCKSYLSVVLTGFTWSGETAYRKARNSYQTPDILCIEEGLLKVAFECKASRMSQQAMFGRNPIAERGFQDLIKAVFQLWRFFSHSRLGHSGHQLADAPVGVVLTLDNWLEMAEPMRTAVLLEAGKLADDSGPEITEIDRKPIVFVPVIQLERTLSGANEKTFVEALIAANSPNYLGWHLDGIHKQLFGDGQPNESAYPFSSEIGKLLPWWDEFDHQGQPENTA